jgi:phosphopantothenoylcysteine decarboxylase/phosphopantothenate--cysteine ligase
MTNTPEIILGITGSIGAYKAGDLVRQLRDAGYAVTCVLTQRATKFIAPLTLQALSERKAYTDLFDLESTQIIHTMLADRAKLVLVAPATANIIGKCANGLADDLLSCLLLATRAKLLFAPAMNVHMWQHPTVQRNMTTLKRLGARFVGPDVGKLACGYEAIGHLAEPEEIVRAVKQLVPIVGAPSGGGTATPAPQRPKRLAATRRRPKPARKRPKQPSRRR